MNNDELALFFMMGAVLYTIRWYRDQFPEKYPHSGGDDRLCHDGQGIGRAGGTGGGGGFPCEAVAGTEKLETVFWPVYPLWPWWYFPWGCGRRCATRILFGVPLNYAEKLKLDDPQFIGNIPVLRRFFDFSPYQFAHLDVQFEEAGTYREFNVFLGLLKTAIFGQTDFYQESRGLTVAGTVLFWMNVVLVVLAAYAIVRSIVTYRRHLAMEKWFLLLGSAVYLLSYFQFCLEYPHICTMNVRYILLLLFTGLFFACTWGQEREADGHGA